MMAKQLFTTTDVQLGESVIWKVAILMAEYLRHNSAAIEPPFYVRRYYEETMTPVWKHRRRTIVYEFNEDCEDFFELCDMLRAE